MNERHGPENLRASYVQRREWALYHLRGDHYPFNMQQSFVVERFDRDYFAAFLQYILARHESLRTTLAWEGGTLWQTIQPPECVEMDYDYYDVSLLPLHDRDAFIREKRVHAKAMAFNMATGPLFRLFVVKLAADAFQIVITGHHILFDEHSLQLFDSEGFAFYKAYFDKDTTALHKPVVQYSHFTHMEERLLTTNEGDPYRAFWAEQCQQEITPIGLASPQKNKARYLDKVQKVKTLLSALGESMQDTSPGVIRRYAGNPAKVVNIGYDRSFLQDLRSWSRTQKVSFLGVLLGSLAIALHKLCGQTSFVFDMPATARPSRHYQGTIGWLSAGGLCFLDIGGRRDNTEVFRYTDRQLFGILNHCIYPFEAVGAGYPLPVGSYIPAFINLSHHAGSMGSVDGRHQAGYTTYQDIAFFFTTYTDGLQLEIAYDQFLFDEQAIDTLTGVFTQELKSLLSICVE